MARARSDRGLLGLAGVLDAIRLARWAGERTWRDPLVLVLHVSFVFLPIGLVLLAFSAVGCCPSQPVSTHSRSAASG